MTSADALLAKAELQAIQQLLGTSEAQETYAKVRQLLEALKEAHEFISDACPAHGEYVLPRLADALKLAGVTAHE